MHGEQPRHVTADRGGDLGISIKKHTNNNMENKKEISYPRGGENKATADLLKGGQACKVIGVGNSMMPILKSRQPVIVSPVTDETEIGEKDIVFCKVRGHYYVHLVHKVKKNGEMFLIGNNHGHMNGWTSRANIFGKVTEILEK